MGSASCESKEHFEVSYSEIRNWLRIAMAWSRGRVDDDIDLTFSEIPSNGLFIQQIKFLSARRKNLVGVVQSLGKVSSDETAAAGN